jgi:hypothetical protein
VFEVLSMNLKAGGDFVTEIGGDREDVQKDYIQDIAKEKIVHLYAGGVVHAGRIDGILINFSGTQVEDSGKETILTGMDFIFGGKTQGRISIERKTDNIGGGFQYVSGGAEVGDIVVKEGRLEINGFYYQAFSEIIEGYVETYKKEKGLGIIDEIIGDIQKMPNEDISSEARTITIDLLRSSGLINTYMKGENKKGKSVVIDFYKNDLVCLLHKIEELLMKIFLDDNLQKSIMGGILNKDNIKKCFPSFYAGPGYNVNSTTLKSLKNGRYCPTRVLLGYYGSVGELKLEEDETFELLGGICFTGKDRSNQLDMPRNSTIIIHNSSFVPTLVSFDKLVEKDPLVNYYIDVEGMERSQWERFKKNETDINPFSFKHGFKGYRYNHNKGFSLYYEEDTGIRVLKNFGKVGKGINIHVGKYAKVLGCLELEGGEVYVEERAKLLDGIKLYSGSVHVYGYGSIEEKEIEVFGNGSLDLYNGFCEGLTVHSGGCLEVSDGCEYGIGHVKLLGDAGLKINKSLKIGALESQNSNSITMIMKFGDSCAEWGGLVLSDGRPRLKKKFWNTLNIHGSCTGVTHIGLQYSGPRLQGKKDERCLKMFLNQLDNGGVKLIDASEAEVDVGGDFKLKKSSFCGCECILERGSGTKDKNCWFLKRADMSNQIRHLMITLGS